MSKKHYSIVIFLALMTGFIGGLGTKYVDQGSAISQQQEIHFTTVTVEGLQLVNEDGQPIATLHSSYYDQPMLTLHEKQKQSRILIGFGAKGTPLILIRDEGGKTLWSTPN